MNAPSAAAPPPVALGWVHRGLARLEDPGAVWLFDNYFIVATRSNLTGVRPSPIGVVTFERAAFAN